MRLTPLLVTGAYALSAPIAEIDNSLQDQSSLDKRQAPPEVSQIVDATKDLTQDPAWKALAGMFNGAGAANMDPAQKSSEAAAAQASIQGLLTKYYSSIPNWQSYVSTATAGGNNQGNANPPPRQGANGPAGGNGGNAINGGPQQSGNNLMDQLISAQAAASRQLASASAASAQPKPPAPASAVVVPANSIPTREPDGIAGTTRGSQNTAPAGNIAGTQSGLIVLQNPSATQAPPSNSGPASNTGGPAGNIAGTRSGLIVLQNTNTASSSSKPPAPATAVVVPGSSAGNIAGTQSGFVVVGNTASSSNNNGPSTVTQTAATPTDATGALLQGIAGLLGGGALGNLGNLIGGSSIATPTGGTLPTAPASGSQNQNPQPGPDGVVTITLTPGSMFPRATTFVNGAVPQGAAPLLAVSFAALIPLLL
ncbi:hypothetical protein CJU90_1805 [Yarrowia sp. C11]|nr:hypothetical protein CKK34_5833 [Yarrowia sp. E02]KAG5371744.1 hypothetical protein CJU90_1805 [Yarrowia sp. C11]